MKWLVGSTLASLVGAFLVVRIFEYVVGGVTSNAVVGATKASLFVTTWTAISTGSGMRAFSKWVRGLRQKTRSLSGWLNTRR